MPGHPNSDGETRVNEGRDSGIGVEQGRSPSEVVRPVEMMQDTTQNRCSIEQGRRMCRMCGMAEIVDVKGREGFPIPDCFGIVAEMAGYAPGRRNQGV